MQNPPWTTSPRYPVGDYKAVITESEVKETKAGDGQYLNLRIEIIEGEYQGRIIFVILNLWNPNPKAVEIANRELATNRRRSQQARSAKLRGASQYPDDHQGRHPAGTGRVRAVEQDQELPSLCRPRPRSGRADTGRDQARARRGTSPRQPRRVGKLA